MRWETMKAMTTIMETIELNVLWKTQKWHTFRKIKCIFILFFMHWNSLFVPENIVMSDRGDYIPLAKSEDDYVDFFFFRCSELDGVCSYDYVPHQKKGDNGMFLEEFYFYEWWMNMILCCRLLALTITVKRSNLSRREQLGKKFGIS